MSAFTLEATDGGARAGVVHTAHGDIRTPAFMPVGTKATVKSVDPDELKALGAEIVLGNTYHLHFRPGEDLIAELGGLHAFMSWDRPILTDSGGFQVFSLRDTLLKTDDDGVTFRSVYDGSPERFTPELAARIQERLGSDIAMCLDICLPAGVPRPELEEAVRRTTLWAARQRDQPRAPGQLRFAITQGGLDTELRRRSSEELVPLDFDGYAIGGLSVGELKDVTAALLRALLAELPHDRPRYLMGVGHPSDLVTYARFGVDLFDCVLPTRLGRNGTVWSDLHGQRLDLSRRALLGRAGPIVADCTCPACTSWSLGTLAALYQSREPLAYRLASMHNLTMLARVTHDLRRAVLYTADTNSMLQVGKASDW